MPVSKVMIIGLDCAEPSLVLERWRGELPVLDGLIERGLHGRLTSVIPPITVPAWSCMMSSRTPGDLGVYGFRNRSDHSYDQMFIANGTAIKEPRLWDYATRNGKRSIVLGVPGTFPPRPLNGVMVTCFLTPSTESQYTYPPMLRREVEQVVGEYMFDVKDFRTEDKEDLLRQVYEMTDRRFALAEHLLATKPWELFAMVEMGHDRMHHGFWKDMDPEHRKHVPGGPYENAILDYHRHVDGLIGRLLEHADDDTAMLVVSDHGAKRMDGGIRVNEWLRREGLLKTLREPEERTSLEDVGIDWSGTTAWGEGGYYSRVFLNVRGREPEGTIAPEDYERVRDDLARRLEAIPDENGQADPDEGLLPRGGLPGGERRRARPDRPLRRPALARGRHGRRRRGHPHLRERHGPGRREPRAARDLRARRARRGARAARRHAPARRRADRARAARDRRAGDDARPQPARAGRGHLSGLAAQRYLTPVTVTVVLNVSAQPALRPSGRTAIRRRVRPGNAFHLNVTMPFAVVRLRRSVNQRPWRGSRRCRSSIVAACGGVTRAVTVTGLPTFARRGRARIVSTGWTEMRTVPDAIWSAATCARYCAPR